jgi:hypothetical protein
MVKNCQNKLKFHLVVEKDRGNSWKKIRKKKSAVFLGNFFRGLSFYGADCIGEQCQKTLKSNNGRRIFVVDLILKFNYKG